MRSSEVKNWYDNYSAKQLERGVNLRHFMIMNHLIGFGLRKDSSILEIGCGIGKLTGLLYTYIKRGKIVGMDISSESVEIARKRIPKGPRIELFATEFQNFNYEGKFDFVVLPDVLEHIPLEQHPDTFERIARFMHSDSQVIIHIPHPKAIEFLKKHSPEKLQIIDQPVSADFLLKNAYQNDLILSSYLSYSIFNKESDYAIIRFLKNQPVPLTPLPKPVIIARKLLSRMKFFLAKI